MYVKFSVSKDNVKTTNNGELHIYNDSYDFGYVDYDKCSIR